MSTTIRQISRFGTKKAVLQHFDSLTLNEQAQYPKDYATRLQKRIALDYNYFTNAVEGEGSPL